LYLRNVLTKITWTT